jgi:nucleoside-diphosphate-sugar epimerase
VGGLACSWGRTSGKAGSEYIFRLSDIVTPPDLAADEKFVKAELSDLAHVEALVKGVDGIIHMGGRSIEDSWDVILNANIVGTYNLYEAARRHNVPRVVFASSNPAIGFYRRRRRIAEQHIHGLDLHISQEQRSAEERKALRELRYNDEPEENGPGDHNPGGGR